MKDFFSPEKKRKNIDIIESKIFQISHLIKKELESGTELENIILKKVNKEELGNLVYHIISKGKFFVKINIEVIKYFLDKYTKYGNFEGDKDFFLSKLSTSMHVETFPKDYLLFRKNDIGDKFYIILKGSVAIVITQEISIEMTEQEYNIHIERLRYFKEYYLLESLISYDNKIEINEELLDKVKDEIYLETTKNRRPKEKDKNVSDADDKKDINPQKFVQRVEPFTDKKAKEPKISVKIPIYKIVATLKTGDTFGEVALSKTEVEERKRTATVITDSECIFGILPNNVYATFLKEVEEKNRYNLVTQLVSHSLFKSILPEVFLKANFLNYFNNMTVKGGNFLFKQGETKESLFFVTDGIINLYTESSIDTIINVIEHLNKDIEPEMIKENKDKGKNRGGENNFDIIREYKFQKKANNFFTKFCKIKRTFKIFNINKKETLGFDDYLLNDNKFFASAKIMSENCHVFVLKLNFLNSMLRENVILRNYNRTNFEKKQIMVNRLTNMVKMLIIQHLKHNQISFPKDGYLEEQKKVEINILKNENISFRGFKNEKEKILRTKYSNKNPLQNSKNKIKINNKYINFFNKNNRLNLDKFLFENKLEKEKSKTIEKQNKKIRFKNKLINIQINFSNDNLQKRKKISLPFVDRIRTINKTEETNKIKEKYDTEIMKQNSDNYINKIIPDIKKLSTKYMIDEYHLGKRKTKNMTQFDFILFENIFVNQGKKKYSKEPLIIDC